MAESESVTPLKWEMSRTCNEAIAAPDRVYLVAGVAEKYFAIVCVGPKLHPELLCFNPETYSAAVLRCDRHWIECQKGKARE